MKQSKLKKQVPRYMNVSFNIELAEGKILNYFVQSQATEKPCKQKHDANTIDINVTKLGRQAVKEHKDIHKLVASKMFNVNYEDVTDEQRCIAKTVNYKYMYGAGLC